MRVHFVRALALAVGVLLTTTALAQKASLTGDRMQIPQPPDMSSYYTPGTDDNYYMTGSQVPAPPADPSQQSQPQTQSQPQAQQQASDPYGICNSCTGGCNPCEACDDCCDLCPVCANCPRHQLVLFSGLDSWQGVGDSANPSGRGTTNNGGSFGFNYGTALGRFSDVTGIGFQGGASYGIYDWSGRPTNPGVLSTTQSQQQTFVTLGFFKRANERSALSYGATHDWMFNQAFGSSAVNPSLGQWRGQIAYATSAWNEFGFWGTLRDMGATSSTLNGGLFSTRPINQANFFWHHKWESFGGDSWIWAGFPQDSRLNPILGGNLGDFLVGGSIIAPLSDYVSVYSNFQYLHPSSRAGNIGQGEQSWYIAFGLQYYLGGAARSQTVAGNCWVPLMPLANNGNFLVDSWLH